MLKTTANENGKSGNGIDGPASEFEVKRKRNGNGDEKCGYGEESTTFSSAWAVTKNLGFMNLLTTIEAKESKMARENKWKGAGSCEWT